MVRAFDPASEAEASRAPCTFEVAGLFRMIGMLARSRASCQTGFVLQGGQMKRFGLRGLVVAAGLSVLACTHASAQELIDGTKPELVEGILKGFGIARLETDSYGDPKISGRADGQAYTLYFYGCTDNENCTNIQFWTYWTGAVELDKINEWNRSTRFGKLYIDSDDDLALVMDINLMYGISEKTMEDNMEVWASLVSRVEKDVLGE